MGEVIESQTLEAQLNASEEADEHAVDPLILLKHVDLANVNGAGSEGDVVDGVGERALDEEHDEVEGAHVVDGELARGIYVLPVHFTEAQPDDVHHAVYHHRHYYQHIPVPLKF